MEGYLGEIRLFAGNFVPLYWAKCQGQLLSIADNAPLFNILGTSYGGDGQATFALPNLPGPLPGAPLSYIICVTGIYPSAPS
jgi:microcystin-dependent protein